MTNARFDIVIIGSGAGGGTMAYALAPSGARILLIERGDFVPQEEENWSPEAVWRHRRYRQTEQWVDDTGLGRAFLPYTHYGVGGNTKFWGSALFRLRIEDFEETAHAGGTSPGWPVDYAAFAPYYDRAEQIYQVHGQHGVDPTDPPRGPYPYAAVPHAPRMAEIAEQLRAEGLHPSALPLGLREGCVLCRTCNSFPCRIHAKSEADVCCVRPALQHTSVTLWTNARAERLVTDGRGLRVTGVDVVKDGVSVRVEAPIVIVSCGAVNSAALFLRSSSPAHPRGLANSSGLVGARYMAHLATMISAFDWSRKNDTVFQKTVAINDYYLASGRAGRPLGQIQSQGRTDPVVLKAESPWYGRWIPLPAWKWWADGAVDWLVMSEDLPHVENRVAVDAGGRIHLRYTRNNTSSHDELVSETSRLLGRLGFYTITHTLGTRNTTHQCGTLCFGTDPRASVLNPFCRTHDVENLFVVDASFFPSSAAVNPGLTIVAQALRVADHIIDTDLRTA
jgi:choline dehydrogenase-like flavoprotein